MRTSFSLKSIGVSAFAVIVFAALTVRSESSRGSRPLVFTSMLASAAPTNPAEPAHEQTVQAILITIRPSGFDPVEVQRTEGPFLLAVDNRSGLDEVTLYLTREGGARVREMRLSPERSRWREKIELPPGRYLLTEGAHKNWLCRITVGS